MGEIYELREESGTNLTMLKAEVLSALSSVATATTTEELQQANAAYLKALSIARNMGYRPHFRAVEGQQLHIEWIAVAGPTLRELPVEIATPDHKARKRRDGAD
jgi:hypothetical protein